MASTLGLLRPYVVLILVLAWMVALIMLALGRLAL